MNRRLIFIVFAAGGLMAQPPAPDVVVGSQPELQALAAAGRGARRSSPVSDEIKAKADKLIAEAQAQQTAGASGEARRRYANALTLLKGQPWDPKQEFLWSLALRPDAIVADSAVRFFARVSQNYSAAYRPASNLKIALSLDGANPKTLGEFDLPTRDLVEQPATLDADLSQVADGAYTLKAQIAEGGVSLVALAAPIQIVKGIATAKASLEARLSKIPGHDSTKATIRYPYVLAETVNSGRRQLNTNDFGGPFQPQLPYDFAAGVKNSSDVLKALEAGKDPLWRAKGDHERHYWFAEANEMMGYRVYVSSKWDGKSKLPMVLVLHGNSRDHNYYFDRDEHILGKLAEQHGYLVVCPMGYRPSAGWGSNSLNRTAGPGRGGPAAEAARARQGEFSEKDGLNVFDLVTKEYPVDPARTYLFGHSAGGAGAWYFGEKFPERWAAVAMSAAPTSPVGFPFERLKGMPLMVIHGEADTEVLPARSQAMVKAAKENGLDPQLVMVPGATHATIVGIIEPQVFEFFGKHHK